MTLFDKLECHAARAALVTAERRAVTYQEMLDLGDGVAQGLAARTLVFMVCRNTVASVAAYVGFLRRKVVPLLLPDTIDRSLLSALIDLYRPQSVYAPLEHNLSNEIAARCGDYALFDLGAAKLFELHDELALLLSTSGSTGSPKLVRISYNNLESNSNSIVRCLRINGSDRAITTMPMSYSYGLSILNTHLISGATVILSEASLTERSFWNLLEAERATTFGGVPYIYQVLKRLRFERMELPSLRYLTQAGGRLDPALCAEFVEICGKKGMEFYVMYGQTEATARMSYLPWEAAAEKPGSVGVPISGGELWLEDENGDRIGEGGVGELVYRGQNVAMGYAVCGEDLAKGDENGGVLRTGDLARRDADGFYYITGRKSRFAKVFGKRVSLDELEQLINAAGQSCACIGGDDRLAIFVEGQNGAELKRYVGSIIGLHPSAISVISVPKLPRNGSGKVQYASLQDMVSKDAR